MKSLRKLSLLLIAVLLVGALVGCSSDSNSVEVTVTVNATDINGSPIVLGDVTFTSENPTVLEALQQMCLMREVACEANETGIVSKIGDAGVSSYVDEETGKNMAIGWSWKLNGQDSEDLSSFSNETVVKTGDIIEYYQYTYESELDPWFEDANKFESNEEAG